LKKEDQTHAVLLHGTIQNIALSDIAAIYKSAVAIAISDKYRNWIEAVTAAAAVSAVLPGEC
jgi:hypothetical protein